MIVAELPPATRLQHLIKDLHDVRSAHAALYETHHAIREMEKFHKDTELDPSNFHDHTNTCF